MATTIAALYLSPVAGILQIRPFPAVAWLAVVAIVTGTTLWSEPTKRAPST